MDIRPDASIQQLVAAIGTPFQLSEDDYMALELLVLKIGNDAMFDVANWGEGGIQQAQVNAVVEQLQVWWEERFVRPERLEARRQRLYKSQLGRASRGRVLKRQAPAWQRGRWGQQGWGTAMEKNHRSKGKK